MLPLSAAHLAELKHHLLMIIHYSVCVHACVCVVGAISGQKSKTRNSTEIKTRLRPQQSSVAATYLYVLQYWTKSIFVEIFLCWVQPLSTVWSKFMVLAHLLSLKMVLHHQKKSAHKHPSFYTRHQKRVYTRHVCGTILTYVFILHMSRHFYPHFEVTETI